MLKIFLACGTGASSGFVAQSMRKAAKRKGTEVSIKAISDTEILEYMSEMNYLLIGPHLKHRFAEIVESVKSFPVKVKLIDAQQYSMLDGDSVLNEILNEEL